MTHARVTGFMKGGDTAAAGLNLLTLLFIALLPFATSLMVSNIGGPDERVAVLVYGINVLVASVMLTLLMAYLVRGRTLLQGEVADETVAALTRQRRVSNGVWLDRGRLRPASRRRSRSGLYVLATVLMLVCAIRRGCAAPEVSRLASCGGQPTSSVTSSTMPMTTVRMGAPGAFSTWRAPLPSSSRSTVSPAPAPMLSTAIW